MKSAKVRLVEHLAGHLRVVDFSWWDLDRILKAAVNKALKDSGTQVVNKDQKEGAQVSEQVTEKTGPFAIGKSRFRNCVHLQFERITGEGFTVKYPRGRRDDIVRLVEWLNELWPEEPTEPRTMVQVHPGRKREVEILKEALDQVEAGRRKEGDR